MVESKRERFCRLAENRMNHILKGIELLGNLSNKSVYEYTDSDVDKMIRALKIAVSNLESTYKVETKSKKFTFK